MNILKKKLYYKFLDLQRLSRFIGEKSLCDFADTVLKKIKSISDQKFDKEFFEVKNSMFSYSENQFIDEYISTGQIQFIEDKIESLPKWLWLLIIPEYIPIEEFRIVFNKYQISSKEDLMAYFKSDLATERYGEDMASLYCYFVENQDSKNFPLRYRLIPNEQTQLIESYCNENILGNFHNHTAYSGRYPFSHSGDTRSLDGAKLILFS